MYWILFTTLYLTAIGILLFLALPKSRGKLAALILYVAGVVPSTFLLIILCLGFAKPILFEDVEGEVLNTYLVENEAIYLTILVNGEPRLISIPWSIQKAEEIQDLLSEEDGAMFYGGGNVRQTHAPPLPPKQRP